MDLGVMIEGQEGLNWELWRQIARNTEDMGFESLWRSDHLVSFSNEERDALESFVSFVLVAAETERIRFGPLVCPMTFRHPSMLARMAAQIDVLSRGRFILGMGAGWNVPEHEAFGISFPKVRERMDRLNESISVVKALWADTPATFDGEYFKLKSATCYPKPTQDKIPILVGGSGEKRTLRIVAEHADEWNAVGVDLKGYQKKRSVLEQHCVDIGRDPTDIRHSQMTSFVIGRDDRAIQEHLRQIVSVMPSYDRGDTEEILQAMRAGGALVGTPSEIVQELLRREEAGLSRTMLQHLAMTNFEVLSLIASDVLPQVQNN